MWARLAKHWFLIALAIAFAIGHLAAESLKPVQEMAGLRHTLVFCVMWAMGVTLPAETVRSSMVRPGPSILAVIVNAFGVPLIAWPAKWWLPDPLLGGLYVAALVPSTLASASVWTRKAGGDDSVAMMTTVVTNLACVVVIPVGIALMLSATVEIDARSQVAKLAAVVVAPLVIAQAMRRAGMAAWADRHKFRLSTLSQCGILIMVVMGAVASSAKVRGPAGHEGLHWDVLGLLVGSAAGVHLVAMAVGIGLARAWQMSRSRQIAVGIAGSQKTLMVGLQIAIDCGVSVVPMLVYHLSQLVLDTVVAERWKARTRRIDHGGRRAKP